MQFFNQYLKKYLNYFLIGVFAFVPIVVILEIVIFVKALIANLLHMVYSYYENYLLTVMFFLISFSIFTYFGYRLSSGGKTWLITAIDTVIDRVPLLNRIYRVTKKIVNMLSGHEQRAPREVVYLEYPKDGLWVPAYVTNRVEDKLVLFVPTSPNPTSGFTIIVDQSKVVKASMTIEGATSFIVSLGVDFDGGADVVKLP